MNSSMSTNHHHHHDSNNQPYTTINHIVLKGTDTDTPAAVAATTTSSSSTKGLSATFASVTEETSSDGALSARSSDNGQAYEVIEYDYDEDANILRIGNQNDNDDDDTSELLAEVVGKTAVITIDDNSPAAAALRANAKIHVSSVGKAARAVQLQSVRRVLKRATGITKSGNKKGKPPRIPPTLLQLQQQQQAQSHLSSNHNNILLSPGPIDVDQYMDAGEMTDHSNNNHNNDILVEGVDEDNADDDDDNNDDDVVNLNIMAHHEMDLAALHHQQYGIDEPSFSEVGGDDHIIMTGAAALPNGSMDESRKNRISTMDPKLSPLKSNHHNDSNNNNNNKAMLTPTTPMDRDMMHIPDGVAPGTVEAGKKGMIYVGRLSVFQKYKSIPILTLFLFFLRGRVYEKSIVLRSVDPYDLLRAVRWKKKKTGLLKKKKSYVKGKVIDGEHELYTLSIAVMIGVRTSISRTNTELNSLKPPLKRWVHPSDFRTTEKYEFHPKGGDGPLLPPHQLAHTFKFKDYCPVVFAYLRRLYGVNEFDFLLSVCGNANFIEFISNAKSGQFFFYSSDGRYMIKTMTNAESKFLRQILPEYFKHCCENPNTLITRFFGMYRVKLYHLRRNVKFVIMNSVYYTDKNLQTFYDLKGSSVGRDAKPGQAVLKDNDLRRSLPENAIALQPQQRSHMRQQLESDCGFLAKMDVMDYSMLVGVHYVPPFEGRTSLTYRKSSGIGRVYSALRIRRSSGTSNYAHNDDSEATSNEGEPTIVQQHQQSHTPASVSPMRGSSTPTDIASSPLVGNKSPLRPSTLIDHNRARSEGKVMPTSIPTSRSPLRPNALTHNNRARSDTWGMSALIEDGLEDDDNSYLLGSSNRLNCTLAVTTNEETERKKQATVEKLFWPFHHLYDIHGHRRLTPVQCNVCQAAPCSCDDANLKAILAGYSIPKFVPPISDRKDGGLEMDMTGVQLPCVVKGGVPNGDLMYDGKIFYMGVIDILQEYNTRKEIESVYRMIQSSSKMAASCVPPQSYGRRFISFFDQYTERSKNVDSAEQGQEVSFRT